MRWPSESALFVCLAVLYVAAGMWTTRRIAATGDEPAYFMAADALVRGEGLDLTARWQAIDTAPYSPGEPIPREEFLRSTAPSRARPGAYPIHDVGLPLLIALPFVLGGRGLVVALIGVGMAVAVALGVRAARALGLSRRSALAGGVAAGLTVPALTYSGQVFPDAVAPIVVGVAACALAGAAPRWAFGVALAALPLLHVRFWPILFGLSVAAIVLWRPNRRDAALIFAPAALTVVGLCALGLAVYGLPLPHAGFLLFFAERRMPIETYAGAHGVVGLFVDRAFGLLPAVPLAITLFAGAGIALRRRPEAVLAVAAVPYLVTVPFVDWTGGFSPQARYLAPYVPLFVLLYARALAWRPAALLALPLAVWSAGQSAVYVAAPWLRYNIYGVPPLADRAWSFVGLAPSGVFPQFGEDGATATLALAWCAVLVALVAFGALRVRGP